MVPTAGNIKNIRLDYIVVGKDHIRGGKTDYPQVAAADELVQGNEQLSENALVLVGRSGGHNQLSVQQLAADALRGLPIVGHGQLYFGFGGHCAAPGFRDGMADIIHFSPVPFLLRRIHPATGSG